MLNRHNVALKSSRQRIIKMKYTRNADVLSAIEVASRKLLGVGGFCEGSDVQTLRYKMREAVGVGLFSSRLKKARVATKAKKAFRVGFGA